MEEIVLKYREISLEIIDRLKKDEDANYLFDKREILIRKLFTEMDGSELIKESFENFNIYNIENEIRNMLEEEMKKTKEEINRVQMSKSATRGYASNLRGGSIFSQKI